MTAPFPSHRNIYGVIINYININTYYSKKIYAFFSDFSMRTDFRLKYEHLIARDHQKH